MLSFFFFFNDTATTEIYTLSLHDALPILTRHGHSVLVEKNAGAGSGYPDETYAKAGAEIVDQAKDDLDRKSTRLNSSHSQISYAVFCLKKKKILAVHIKL